LAGATPPQNTTVLSRKGISIPNEIVDIRATISGLEEGLAIVADIESERKCKEWHSRFGG
jgi:hypothetical protein